MALVSETQLKTKTSSATVQSALGAGNRRDDCPGEYLPGKH